MPEVSTSSAVEQGEQVAFFINALRRNLDPELLDLFTGSDAGQAWYGLIHGYITGILGQHIACPAREEREARDLEIHQESMRSQQAFTSGLVAALEKLAAK